MTGMGHEGREWGNSTRPVDRGGKAQSRRLRPFAEAAGKGSDRPFAVIHWLHSLLGNAEFLHAGDQTKSAIWVACASIGNSGREASDVTSRA